MTPRTSGRPKIRCYQRRRRTGSYLYSFTNGLLLLRCEVAKIKIKLKITWKGKYQSTNNTK
jgi:hypothetical protein